MNSINILFLIVVSLAAYSLVATYLFWLIRHDQLYLNRKLSGARSDISTLATAYETLRSLLERNGKNQAEVIDLIAEANKRIDRLEDKRTYKPKVQSPRPPRPLRSRSERKQQRLTATNIRYSLYNADTLNRYAKGCHQRSVAKGFWNETHSVGHCLMLAFGELHEAIEADRLGKWAKLSPESLKNLQVISDASFTQAFLWCVKDRVEDEIADAVIRLLDLLGHLLDGTDLPAWQVSCFDSVYGEDGIPPMLTDALIPIVATLCDADANCDTTTGILYAIKSLEHLCDHLGIDLMAHIELKLKYNETRPILHGKKY